MLRTTTCFCAGLKPSAWPQFAIAFDDHDAALLDPLDPLRDRAGATLRTIKRLAGPPAARVSPIEERICGQGPGSSPAI